MAPHIVWPDAEEEAGLDAIREVSQLTPIDDASGLSRASISKTDAEAFSQQVAQLIGSGEANRWIEQAGLEPYTFP